MQGFDLYISIALLFSWGECSFPLVSHRPLEIQADPAR